MDIGKLSRYFNTAMDKSGLNDVTLTDDVSGRIGTFGGLLYLDGRADAREENVFAINDDDPNDVRFIVNSEIVYTIDSEMYGNHTKKYLVDLFTAVALQLGLTEQSNG